MLWICDECGDTVKLVDMIPIPYIEGETHLGLVKEWLFCINCAELELKRSIYGLDPDSVPGI